MLLDVLDDVFLLNLALEAAECAFDRLAFLNLDFSHALKHPLTPLVATCNDLRKVANMLGYHRQARILGVTRPDVNEIVVCRTASSAQSFAPPFGPRGRCSLCWWPPGVQNVQVIARPPVSLNP